MVSACGLETQAHLASGIAANSKPRVALVSSGAALERPFASAYIRTNPLAQGSGLLEKLLFERSAQGGSPLDPPPDLGLDPHNLLSPIGFDLVL